MHAPRTTPPLIINIELVCHDRGSRDSNEKRYRCVMVGLYRDSVVDPVPMKAPCACARREILRNVAATRIRDGIYRFRSGHAHALHCSQHARQGSSPPR